MGEHSPAVWFGMATPTRIWVIYISSVSAVSVLVLVLDSILDPVLILLELWWVAWKTNLQCKPMRIVRRLVVRLGH